MMRRGVHTVTTKAIRIVEVRSTTTQPPNKRSPLSRFLFGSGLVLTGTGVALTIQSGRPSRPALALLGSGSLLVLANSPFFSIPALSGLVIGGTGAGVLSVYWKDAHEREIQNIVIEAIQKGNFPANMRFDDSGPEPHAVSRPQYEVLIGPLQAALEGKKEVIKVRISGYCIGVDGNYEQTVGIAYASRSGPFAAFTFDRVEMQRKTMDSPPSSFHLTESMHAPEKGTAVENNSL